MEIDGLGYLCTPRNELPRSSLPTHTPLGSVSSSTFARERIHIGRPPRGHACACPEPARWQGDGQGAWLGGLASFTPLDRPCSEKCGLATSSRDARHQPFSQTRPARRKTPHRRDRARWTGSPPSRPGRSTSVLDRKWCAHKVDFGLQFSMVLALTEGGGMRPPPVHPCRTAIGTGNLRRPIGEHMREQRPHDPLVRTGLNAADLPCVDRSSIIIVLVSHW